ncbi:hypothetical protein ABPG75_007660 [Micractinium tetrahymenae]
MRLARLAARRSLLLELIDSQITSVQAKACPARCFSSVAAASSAWRPSRAPLALWGARRLGRAAAFGSSPSSAAFSSAAAAPASATAAGTALRPDTPIADAVRLTCEQLGRPFASEAVEALLDNWYSTAGELAALPDETARSLGIPLRLRSAVAEALQGSEAAGPTAGVGYTSLAPGAAAGSDVLQDAATQHEQQRSRSSSPGGRLAGSAAASADQQQQGQQEPGGAGESSLPAAAAAVPTSSSSSSSRGSLAAAAQQVTAAVDPFFLPIEQRRCPPQRRFGNSAVQAPRVVQRSKASRYALSEEEMSDGLRAEFAAFHDFLTVRFFGAQSEPIREDTALKYADHMRGALGWLHRERGVPLQELSFARLLPSSARDGVSLVFDYILWLTNTRDISVRTEGIVVRSACAAAKFLFHSESKVKPGRGETPYSDLEVVKELRSMANLAKKRGSVAPRRSDEEAKWLTWYEYLDLCEELRRECAALDSTGRRRSDAAVAWSLQKYLIFAILSCVPDRQRTLRELQVGRTLVRDREGRWVIRHGPEDYKTGRSYGERPPLVISPQLYPELDAFIARWRACLGPAHDLLLTQKDGKPLTDKSLYTLFWKTAYRLTGKRTNPHLVRDMIVTHLRGSGASERELEALAIYMGHSVEMQRDSYDRRTKEQKVEPAVELLASLNRRAMASSGASSGSESEP